jgi:hypothetical protein
MVARAIKKNRPPELRDTTLSAACPPARRWPTRRVPFAHAAHHLPLSPFFYWSAPSPKPLRKVRECAKSGKKTVDDARCVLNAVIMR